VGIINAETMFAGAALLAALAKVISEVRKFKRQQHQRRKGKGRVT